MTKTVLKKIKKIIEDKYVTDPKWIEREILPYYPEVENSKDLKDIMWLITKFVMKESGEL